MRTYNKIVLQYETEDQMLQGELSDMYSLVNTIVNIAHFKPEIKKRLEEEPEELVRDVLEAYISTQVDNASDTTRDHMEKHNELVEHIRDISGGMPLNQEILDSSMYEETFEHYVDVLHEARDIVIDFFINDKNYPHNEES